MTRERLESAHLENRQLEPQGSRRTEAVPGSRAPERGRWPGAVLFCPLAGVREGGLGSALLFVLEPRTNAILPSLVRRTVSQRQ